MSRQHRALFHEALDASVGTLLHAFAERHGLPHDSLRAPQLTVRSKQVILKGWNPLSNPEDPVTGFGNDGI